MFFRLLNIFILLGIFTISLPVESQNKGVFFNNDLAEYFEAPAADLNSKTILILPGGGYQGHALNKSGVSSALHIYPSGGHGWGFRESFPYHEMMLEELATWLSNLK